MWEGRLWGWKCRCLPGLAVDVPSLDQYFVVIVREWPNGGRSFKAENSHHKDNLSVVSLIPSVTDI